MTKCTGYGCWRRATCLWHTMPPTGEWTDPPDEECQVHANTQEGYWDSMRKTWVKREVEEC